LETKSQCHAAYRYSYRIGGGSSCGLPVGAPSSTTPAAESIANPQHRHKRRTANLLEGSWCHCHIVSRLATAF
jgi:hypothetical protein